MSRPRRNRSGYLTVSLFPFLSILVATMGTLILVITAMSLISIQTGKQIVQSPAGVEKKACYVECRPGGLLIHATNQFVSVDRISRPNSPWTRFLEQLSFRPDVSLVLLVRQDGLEAFQKANASITVRNRLLGILGVGGGEAISVGYEPIAAAGPIEVEEPCEISLQ
uniref:Uncharacterized protein n=1 Tax=Candidatus Kentrum eta TaxID=2126337 RepID=A0A450UCH1_9GAMM|nr:MAG: hypothetical protein BECKH772A_GA0070896_1000623 [Candidatus Kentron sp. H]VFJ89988.1 MAG: hypothetical protein BECKH772B_GA0070898_1000723 [Candidatus Kentron sp. H]VFJ96371.1 MAG: hypothetical protein BECKH772C_GA0070978_1000623 [Candidatus Kentron sp. H]